jgi:hypothetical protein
MRSALLPFYLMWLCACCRLAGIPCKVTVNPVLVHVMLCVTTIHGVLCQSYCVVLWFLMEKDPYYSFDEASWCAYTGLKMSWCSWLLWSLVISFTSHQHFEKISVTHVIKWMVSHSPFVVFAHLSGITKDCQIEWRLSRSSSLVYYTIMKGKSELYQNGSMYCTWFVTASTWDIVLNLVSYGTGTLSHCSCFGWTTSGSLSYDGLSGVCIYFLCCCAFLWSSTLAIIQWDVQGEQVQVRRSKNMEAKLFSFDCKHFPYPFFHFPFLEKDVHLLLTAWLSYEEVYF